MVSTWPRTLNEVAARERGRLPVDDALDVAGDRAEVAVLHVAVDIEGAADVVVGDDGRLGGALRCWRRRRGFPVACAVGAAIGMFSRSCRDWIWYCGVCATMV